MYVGIALNGWTLIAVRVFRLDMAKNAEAAPPIVRIGKRPTEVAADFEREALTELEQVGGTPGCIAKAVLKIAALQYATCQELFRIGAEEHDRQSLSAAGTLANGARQNLVAAYKLALEQAGPSTAAHGLDEFLADGEAQPTEAKQLYHPKAKREKPGRPRSNR